MKFSAYRNPNPLDQMNPKILTIGTCAVLAFSLVSCGEYLPPDLLDNGRPNPPVDHPPVDRARAARDQGYRDGRGDASRGTPQSEAGR